MYFHDFLIWVKTACEDMQVKMPQSSMWSTAPSCNGKCIPWQLMLKVYPEALAPSMFVVTWRNWPSHIIQFNTFFPLSPTFAGTCSSSSSWGCAADWTQGVSANAEVQVQPWPLICRPGLLGPSAEIGTDCTVVTSNPGIHIKLVNYKLIYINYKLLCPGAFSRTG